MSTPTRYPEIGYEQQAEQCWRFIDQETGAAIGAIYPTKRELLADVERFAVSRGFAEATPDDAAVAIIKRLAGDLDNVFTFELKPGANSPECVKEFFAEAREAIIEADAWLKEKNAFK